jgi:hypothetical protein
MTRSLRVLVGLCAALGLLLAVPNLKRVFPDRASGRIARYRSLDAWLDAHALPQDRVLVPEPAARHFRARTVVPAPAGADTQALMDLLRDEHPAYCLAFKSLAWDGVRAQVWFRDRYHPVQRSEDAADGSAPLTLFLYRPTRFDRGVSLPLALAFVDDAGTRVDLEAVRVSSSRIVPGEPLAVTLTWGPPEPDDLPLEVALHLRERVNARIWTRVRGDVPRRHFVLTPPETVPEGTYALDVALYHPSGQPLRAVTPESQSRTGPQTLATLTHPPDVSLESPDPDFPIRASLGDAIDLVGYDVPAWVSPGETFRVALYWHAVREPADDYMVFVHVLDGEGQLLAQSDGKPVYWTYPTDVWQGGEIVRDVHVMTLDPEIVRQDAQVRVGMVASGSGIRLPITRASGERVPNGALPLHILRVR